MNALTIKDLYEECEKQIKLGNGYHYCWYTFCTVEDALAEEYIDEEIGNKDNTIILG